MWRELISRIDADAEFSEPADEGRIRTIEEQLGQTLPDELRQLLLESDGVSDQYGSDVVWNTERILADNRSFRSEPSYRGLYQPFDALVFFGDNGGGDQFAFIRTPERPDVFVWDHETDSRTWVAGTLEQYIVRSFESDGEDWYR